ncbi:large proline-rich protein BAG6 isoform X2 [Anguilla rostrata]|uniref:large proline-rich protein BAG6 isoform X2 n=1 Tax=Anguilla rostrata TaxID=7938 RepID=UPI0030CBD2D2
MDEPSTIEVTVKTLDSQSRSYTVRSDLTVKQFKEHISISVGIPVDKQRLIYQGRVLQDEKTLTEYNVDGKVIHLVERAPPQTTHTGSGVGGVSGGAGGAEGAMPSHSSASGSQGAAHMPTHDRNGNSYVMLGTFNLPMNIMDPQQIQMSVQQMMSGLGENTRSARVSTSTGSNGSVDVHIDMDQSVQSEPRLRLILAENLLRDTDAVIRRLEGQSSGSSQQESAAPPSSSSSTPSPSAQPMDTSPPAPPPPPPSSSSSSTQTEGPPLSGPNHPCPADLVEVLSELRRVEERLQPFVQRTHSILGSATSADYNNNTQEREEDQRILNLVGEALRPLGNALVALSDLRCNLLAPPPRHLHVIRPMSHYTSPLMMPGGLHHIPIPINLGSTVTMTTNGRQAAQDQSQPAQSADQSEQQGQEQVPPPQPASANQQPGQGHAGPRMIRISHQTMEPVVMMQMNLDDSGSGSPTSGQQTTAAAGQTGPAPPVHIPGLPPEFMQAIVQQITQQAVAMATAASAGQQGQQAATDRGATANSAATTTTTPTPTATPTVPPHPPQARVVITRPSFAPRVPQPNLGTRGATINLRATVPPSAGPQPAQMINALVGQLLMPVHMADHTSTPSSTHSFSFSSSPSSSSSSTSTTSTSQPTSSANTSGQTSTGTTSTASMGGTGEAGLAQLLGSLLAGGAGGPVAGSGVPTSITVTMPGVPVFIQGVTDFIQATQPAFSPSPTGQQPPSASTTPTPPPTTTPTPTPTSTPNSVSGAGIGGPGGPGESLSPELFTGIVQGVLSTMMGSLGGPQNNAESIAQFIQRLSQTSNIFTPGTGDAIGFFGDLLALVCQSFSMLDLVLLLHGQHQPLSRIQPQLTQFFTEHYLHGREATEANIAAGAEELINGLEEYITDSFSTVTVLEGVDVTQTNMSFFRQQFTRIATHILLCTDHTFGPRLLHMCNQALFECLALNLYCLGGEQTALTAVINHRIRRMSAEVNPSLVNWLTSMMSMRLQVILEHIPVTEDQVLHYVVHTQGEATDMEESDLQCIPEFESHNVETDRTLSPAPATTAEEAMVPSREVGAVGLSPQDPGAVGGASLRETREGGAMAAAGRREESGGETEPWAAAVPPEWVPIIRNDLISQRKIKAQPPLSDAYLHGMPAKRRKTAQGEGPHLTLSEAVSRAAKSAGVRPVTAPGSLQAELESDELQEAYADQVRSDIKKRVREDPEFDTERFPNTQRAFSLDSNQ